jgi:acyl-CoA synthetase (AMP-forming)/AMP-acid ligase II
MATEGEPQPSVADVHAALLAAGSPYEIEEVTLDGRTQRVWKHAPESLAEVVATSRTYGDRVFAVFEDERMTFEEHAVQVARTAHVLRRRFAVGKGDRVAIAMRNQPEWSIAFCAAAVSGAVAVPLNAWWNGPDLVYALEDSGAKVVFCDQERLDLLADRVPPAVRVVVVNGATGHGAGGAERLDDLLRVSDLDVALPSVEITPEDDATILYTSGTSGRPKGVRGTHRNICTNLVSLGFVAARTAMRSGLPTGAGPPPPAVYLLSVPFFHVTGLHSVLVPALANGTTLVLMRKWDAGAALELIERERVTMFGGVPATARQLVDHVDFPRRDTSSLVRVAYGGAPAAPELLRRISAVLPGRTTSNGYGLTETSSVVSVSSGVDYVRHPDSIGLPVPVCDVEIVDAAGEAVAPGDVGELRIRGPNVVPGYWNRADETDRSFRDGWLCTGDLGRVDADGFLYLVDRAKDIIIRGGENIASVEVEAALFELAAVQDAAVIGVPHDVLGEEVGAVVCVRPGTGLDEGSVREFLASRLAAFKVPTRIWIRDEPLPRNPAGKVLKRELKDELLGD